MLGLELSVPDLLRCAVAKIRLSGLWRQASERVVPADLLAKARRSLLFLAMFSLCFKCLFRHFGADITAHLTLGRGQWCIGSYYGSF